MGRAIAFLYGLACYIIFLGTFLYAIGFVGNILVPKSIDTGPVSPLGTALLINALLLAAFAIQHTIMARQGFKKAWTKIIPQPVERSTFVLFTTVILMVMYWQWRPMPEVIWAVQSPLWQMVLNVLFWAGFGIVLLSTFLIDHFDLFGMRQVTLYLQKKEYTGHQFRTPGFYQMIRHPLYFGFIMAFWATPTMTMGHLFFAIMTTAYIFVGISFEERDLVRAFPQTYPLYRKQVPMIIPFTRIGKSSAAYATADKQESRETKDQLER